MNTDSEEEIPQALTWRNQKFVVTTNNDLLDIDAIHCYLTRSSWATGIDIDTVQESLANSLNFGLFTESKQIGLARVVTDFATFGYLCDVYVLEEYQQQKLGSWLMECCLDHPVLKRLRRIMLLTSTAPWLYEKAGYSPVNKENYVWAITRPDMYQSKIHPALVNPLD
ncbi:GNAT family N-acetyltransferase [Pectobacterium versatile]|uniref:GNAT family N-acetyltransferase n=1 Tax=Pectobacterium versatile TaxID=2488639 RepID=UPI000CDEDAD0|nr:MULTISPECIES: GNAT family N-acetyltransferase [Pectobacterium]AVT60672.1 GCN5-related N-acetyltransferase [Pectobacterium versatile]MCL6339750.1 N-acetyltransferase [Pectobacterium carotovorum subsp. carotovorum]MCL6344052.1 N-acetyltransferase [Pectobacterium carotovorum subsp. carotovorum]MCL6365483.1 N-acetyltransferase [Pectobacterium carotovorum subsp. carotovorum]MCL6397779.1 N-acetyltransferase [Pectobacterium carotovorum subsp. carotovorum]